MNRRDLISGTAALAALVIPRNIADNYPPRAWMEARAFLASKSKDTILREGITDLLAMAGDMPHDIRLWVDRGTDNVLVCNRQLGFCVTRQAMRDGLHKQAFLSTLKVMVETLNDPVELARAQRA